MNRFWRKSSKHESDVYQILNGLMAEMHHLKFSLESAYAARDRAQAQLEAEIEANEEWADQLRAAQVKIAELQAKYEPPPAVEELEP